MTRYYRRYSPMHWSSDWARSPSRPNKIQRYKPVVSNIQFAYTSRCLRGGGGEGDTSYDIMCFLNPSDHGKGFLYGL